MVAYVVFTMLLLLLSQTNQDNYWLWWIPLFLPPLFAERVAPPSVFEVSVEGAVRQFEAPIECG